MELGHVFRTNDRLPELSERPKLKVKASKSLSFASVWLPTSSERSAADIFPDPEAHRFLQKFRQKKAEKNLLAGGLFRFGSKKTWK
jgi:hypothetical protein